MATGGMHMYEAIPQSSCQIQSTSNHQVIHKNQVRTTRKLISFALQNKPHSGDYS